MDRQSRRQRSEALTSDLGVETLPVFSPDGKTIAFSAQYDGNTDVYTIPISGGVPKRLTYHPGPDLVRGFTPDGKVLFNSNRNVFSNRHFQLFTVGLAGGMPDQLAIPHGFEACYSPDGTRIAYCPERDVTAQWKNYRGGTHSRIWLYHNKSHAVEPIPQPKGRCNDLDPVWMNDTLYFRSDRNGEYNVFAYNVDSKALKQITTHTDFPVLDIAGGGGNLVYEQAGYLHRLDPVDGKSTRLKIGIAIDLNEARPRYAKGAKYIRGAAVSPSGCRAAFEFRGEIVTVPAEKGDPRNLTNSPDVYERDPAWSPDGKTIAYFSDAGGEYQLRLEPQNGHGEVKKIKLAGAGFYQNLVWSRDSKKVLFSDNSESLYWLDVATGKQTRISEPKYGRNRGSNLSSWSHDSKWVAYTEEDAAKISRVYVYSLEKNKSFPITDGLSEATEPVFDVGGKYLYFLSSTDAGMSKHGFMQSSADSQRPHFSLNLVVLQKDVPSPFLKESDEEKGEQPKSKEGISRAAAAAHEGDEPAGAKPGPKAAANGKKPKDLKIDLKGIDQRILSLPISAGSYSNLQAGAANQIYYIARSDSAEGGRGRGGPAPGALHRYDLDKRKNETIQPAVVTYELTPDGRKMLYATSRTTWLIGSSGPSPMGAMAGMAAAMSSGSGRRGSRGGSGAGPGEAKTLNLDAIEVRVEPPKEWKQIFHEAWRINRDFFYAPNMHGADWPAMEKKYAQFLPDLTSNADLYKVIRWMLSELSVGHSYHTPGERPFEKKNARAACSAPITRWPTAAIDSKRSTAG